ncbi:MAG: sulfatase-like hydrolase/transferase, partial [Methylococcaceae bacterium]|nr:sulfatase-like hydrolase/transferase [Methylococcaceae bacterium]
MIKLLVRKRPLSAALALLGLSLVPASPAMAAKPAAKPATTAAAAPSEAEQKKPNIVIIWGDDIGQTNVSAYSKGLMGYQTPNIDRVANEGVIFTDYYAEQSCTAGRSAFI